MSESNLSGSVSPSDETEDAYKGAAGNNYDCLVGIYCPDAGDGTTAYLDAILSTKAFVVTPSNLSDFQSDHPYETGIFNTWTYVDNGATEGFLVTFDDKTFTAERYDHIWILDANGMVLACYTGDALDISGWDTSSVTDMYGMFTRCSSLTALDVSSWDISSVTDMAEMFSGCHALASLDLSSFGNRGRTSVL